MQAGEIYLIFTEPLDALRLDYVVTGSVASSSYGEPRFTHAIDLVLSLPLDSIAPLWSAYPAEQFYCPPEAALRTEAKRAKSGHFNLVHHESGFKADVYVASDDELTAWAFQTSRAIQILPGRTIRLAPPEYVILGKLQFYTEGGGERHIRDIRAMLAVGDSSIDDHFLSQWIERLGVHEAWAEVNQS